MEEGITSRAVNKRYGKALSRWKPYGQRAVICNGYDKRKCRYTGCTLQ